MSRKEPRLRFLGKGHQRPGLGRRSSEPQRETPPTGPTSRSRHPDRARKGDPAGIWEVQENRLRGCLSPWPCIQACVDPTGPLSSRPAHSHTHHRGCS